ncbi:unnamed protein product [Darwinula stevensoni]|uniref:Uncharacterized protein n=1 Tax=Darwinula stevensoni TaxID=69355 RepID=A0A7R8X2N8_9CRUS|nr:unnamed protein product [Darwinula stevensoni]CAG0884151.1 unnamed protein product [Darwinula stevensoni]
MQFKSYFPYLHASGRIALKDTDETTGGCYQISTLAPGNIQSVPDSTKKYKGNAEGRRKMEKIILLLVLSLAMNLAMSVDVRQVATIYDLPDFNVGGAWCERIEYCPELDSCVPSIGNDVVSSACVLGIWLFYSENFYNYEDYGSVEWIYGDDVCENLETVGDQVSSLKYVGHLFEWKKNTMNLYELDLFAGLEFHEWNSTAEVPALSGVGSVIVTGTQSWTLYTLPDYSGDSACLTVESGKFAGFAADITALGIGTVGSFRLGCFSDRTIRLDSDRHGVAVKARK